MLTLKLFPPRNIPSIEVESFEISADETVCVPVPERETLFMSFTSDISTVYAPLENVLLSIATVLKLSPETLTLLSGTYVFIQNTDFYTFKESKNRR